MPFDIKERRSEIERVYIGFNPNTTRVRPSHLANGMFRTMLGVQYDTANLFKFVLTSKSDGSIPYGHDSQIIYKELESKGKIDIQTISIENLNRLRLNLRKIVAADGTVYIDKEATAKRAAARMDSYSAGSAKFVSADRIAQDAGEFLGLWLQRDAISFTTALTETLKAEGDPISLIAYPLLNEHTPTALGLTGLEEARWFKAEASSQIKILMQATAEPAEVLTEYLVSHPDNLTRLRMAMLLGTFLVVRYLSDLEYGYNLANRRPVLLLDFSGGVIRPIRLASEMSYITLCRSLTRFYAWMFGDYLRCNFSPTELVQTPTYGKKAKISEVPLYEEIWQTALDEGLETEDKYQVLGQAVYDILALDANATPIHYLRQIGIHGGLFRPPYRFVTTKYIAPQRDLLEVLLRSVMHSKETIDLIEIQTRLRERFGIIIGGHPDDLDYLLDAGIYQADAKALEQNQFAFTEQLKDLSFARLLADGVLEVQVGNVWN
jgi:hypothetical protein